MEDRKIIELIDVCKTFHVQGKSIPVLNNVNFHVREGERLCIVGPSGCGKTTIQNMIAGFFTPTSGSILVGGNPIVKPGADRAMVFQKDSVYPWLTVRQNLEFGPATRGIPRKEYKERVDYYLDRVDLRDFADRFPKELSGGMRKRVDIARAYVNDPDILLMDEPFGSLDVMTKENMQVSLLELSRAQSKTIIFITHDIEEAVFLGHRVLVMTARPARLRAEIITPFASEKNPAIKMDAKFQQIRREISDIFKGVEQNEQAV